jgi:hypothetical protein
MFSKQAIYALVGAVAISLVAGAGFWMGTRVERGAQAKYFKSQLEAKDAAAEKLRGELEAAARRATKYKQAQQKRLADVRSAQHELETIPDSGCRISADELRGLTGVYNALFPDGPGGVSGEVRVPSPTYELNESDVPGHSPVGLKLPGPTRSVRIETGEK